MTHSRKVGTLTLVPSPGSRPLTSGQVAEILGVSVSTVALLADRNELPAFRLSKKGHRRFHPADVKAYLAKLGRDTGDAA